MSNLTIKKEDGIWRMTRDAKMLIKEKNQTVNLNTKIDKSLYNELKFISKIENGLSIPKIVEDAIKIYIDLYFEGKEI